MDRLSRDSELELEIDIADEIDISKEEFDESPSPSDTRSERRFAELSESNVKKFENLCNDFKEDESINDKQKEDFNKNPVVKELTVEEAMEALHCEETSPAPAPESGISEFAFKEPYCVTTENNIESGNLEIVDDEIDQIEKSTLEKSESSINNTNPQNNSKETEETNNMIDINSNLDNASAEKEGDSELVIEDHSSDKKPKSPPDSNFPIRELQKEDCSTCQVCEVSIMMRHGLKEYNISLVYYQVPFKPTVNITWNIVTLQLHFQCECGAQYCVPNISTK